MLIWAAKTLPWLTTDFGLSLFGTQTDQARSAYTRQALHGRIANIREVAAFLNRSPSSLSELLLRFAYYVIQQPWPPGVKYWIMLAHFVDLHFALSRHRQEILVDEAGLRDEAASRTDGCGDQGIECGELLSDRVLR